MIQFNWRVGNLVCPLMEVRPQDMEILRARSNPFHTGIPMYYVIVDGEPEWWPDAMEGWPDVRVEG